MAEANLTDNWAAIVKIEVNILVSSVIICAVLLPEYVINIKQFQAPKHQDRLTEILDAW